MPPIAVVSPLRKLFPAKTPKSNAHIFELDDVIEPIPKYTQLPVSEISVLKRSKKAQTYAEMIATDIESHVLPELEDQIEEQLKS